MNNALSWYTVGGWKSNIWYTLTYPTIFTDVITSMAKHDVSTSWIDYEWIEPGLADHLPIDDVIEALKK